MTKTSLTLSPAYQKRFRSEAMRENKKTEELISELLEEALPLRIYTWEATELKSLTKHTRNLSLSALIPAGFPPLIQLQLQALREHKGVEQLACELLEEALLVREQTRGKRNDLN